MSGSAARSWRAAALSLAMATACALPTGGDPVRLTRDSPELADASVEDGVWESAPWSGSLWIPFGPRATVELEHSLGRSPRVVLAYLSFDPEGASAALAAGDLATVVAVSESTVTLRNDTNSEFFLRVVAY